MVLFGIGDEEEDCPAHDEDETDFSHVLDYVACQLTVKVSGSRAQVRETSWTTACCSRGSEKPELRDDVPARSGEPDVAVGTGGNPRGERHSRTLAQASGASLEGRQRSSGEIDEVEYCPLTSG